MHNLARYLLEDEDTRILRLRPAGRSLRTCRYFPVALRIMKKVVLTLFTLFFSVIQVSAQAYEQQIDSLIQKAIRLNRFNGSVFVCKNGRIIYEKAFGYQDATKKIPNTARL